MLDHLNYYAASIRLRRAATTEEQALPDGTYLENYVGNNQISYPTVKIGTQVFTAVNLAETKWRNGDWIAGYDDGVYTPISNENWALLSTSALCFYSDEVANYGEILSATKGFGIGDTIYFDATLTGNGTASNPIGINPDSVLTEEVDPIYEADSASIKTHIRNDADLSSTNEIQNLSKSKTGNNVTVNISGGTGTTFSVADADSSATNEIQPLQSVLDTGNEATKSTTAASDSIFSFWNKIALTSGSATNKTYGFKNYVSYTGSQNQSTIGGQVNYVSNTGTGSLTSLGGIPLVIYTGNNSQTTNLWGFPVTIYNRGYFNKLMGQYSWIENYSYNASNNDVYGFTATLKNYGFIDAYSGFQVDAYNEGQINSNLNGLLVGLHGDSISDMYGVRLGGESHAWTGSPTNSYGIFIDRSIDRGSSLRYSILSESRSLNRLYGNFQLDTLKGTGNRFAMVDANGLFSATKKDSISYWNDAYANKIVSAAFSGTSTKTLTLTQQDGGTVTANFDDNTGNGMVYPGVGIPLSTGSAWATSITDNSTNWNTAYSNRIATFTTTGSSGAATFSGNTLNIPNYTLSGLGGQPALNGTGFVKISGTTISYDNSTYLTAEVDGSTTNELQTATLDSTSTTVGLTLSGNNSRIHFNALKSEVDGSTTNELQTATLDSTATTYAITLSGNNSRVHFLKSTGTDSQTLTIDSTASTVGISISGGNRVHFDVGGTGGGVNSYTMLPGVVTDRNINVNLTDYTPAEGDIISVIPDDDIATGDTITFSVNGGTVKDILGYTSHDSQYSLELVYLTDAWGLLGKKAEEYSVKGDNTGDQDLTGIRDTLQLHTDSLNAHNERLIALESIEPGTPTLTIDSTANRYYLDAGGNTVNFAKGGSGSMVYPEAGIALSAGSVWAGSITNNSVNWNTAYSDRFGWDGGTSGLSASTGRTSLGGTTVGQSYFTLTNPSAITFPRMNADNTVSALSATDFRTAIGAGTLSVEVDGNPTNEIEVVDEVYNATNFNGATTQAVSQDDFYDFNHIADTDDDGLANKVDLASVGFVKTDASGNLTVDGNTYLTSFTAGNTGQVIYNSGGSLTSDADLTYSSAALRIGASNGTGTVTSGNFILSSDRRLKEHIKRLSNLLWVDSIQFNQFNFKSDEQKRLRYGVIAQEVEKVNPELVHTDNDGIKSVSYIDLLIAKVARQDEIIQQLLERIEKLESENNKSSQEYLIDVNVKGSTINTFNNEK